MELQPIKTEKSLKAAAVNRYTFRVKTAADKPTIKRAVEKAFGVKVEGVQTTVIPGKAYRAGRRGKSKQRSDWKKAVVSVAPGQKIDIYGA